jgi:predicted RNA-binding Zn ribbon-like protein
MLDLSSPPDSLALDFSNTADWHASEQPVETLPSWADLLRWSVAAATVASEDAARLADCAMRQPERAAAVYERAIGLREATYRVFSAHARGATPAPDDLLILNREMSIAFDHVALRAVGDGFAWEWMTGEDALDQMLWPLAVSAGRLLTSATLPRVRECAGHPCGWLFIDTSRNRSRRWCSMESCGNRAKAKRHYDRSRVAGA